MEQKPFNYVFTPLAEQDMDEIFNYISSELYNPQAADRLINRIQEEVERICAFPYSRPLLFNKILNAKGYRMIIVDNFNLFYVIKNKTVIIRRVLYGRRNYETIL